ncbi:MAG: DNA gyrase subunit A [Eubacteriaceae bacterium]|nr:DNA gyrase subunit A [Eubacteriaceae bacterium]
MSKKDDKEKKSQINVVSDDAGIQDVDFSSEMQKSYIDYAMSVIVGRALPDVRDGLKPVHRRILYAMDELGARAGTPYRKSARIVGDVMGKYHPHGDAAIYDAMARLAQDFTIRYPLVDGQGNFGSVDGDSPAASRYTEARMSRLSSELLRDIGKDTVDFTSNFDDTLKEPAVLPSRFPNLLVNGSNGIAVGMATNIPPHNLGEVIDATVALMENGDLTPRDLMKYVKGPDFPTGGIIMGRSGITNAYTTGRGRIKVRAKARIEQVNANKQRIVITEIPYMVNKAMLVQKIAELVKDKKIVGISDIHDFSDRNGMQIVIDLKRDTNANILLNQLYNQTQLQDTFGVIMLVLDHNHPKVMNLKEILQAYIAHQEEVIIRRTKYDLDKALARAHILEGYLIALDNLDEVIQIIRSSYDDAEQRLMARFNLSDIQAKAIVDMQLRRLQGLEREKIETEYAEIEKNIAYYKAVLASEQMVKDIIKTELLEIKDRYGDPRLTDFENDEDDFEAEDLIEEEDVAITMTHVGYIKRIPSATYKQQRRGGKGISAHSTRENDFVEHLFMTTTHSYIVFFTNKGKCYRLKAYEVPVGGRTGKGTAIVNILPIEPGEKITAVLSIKDYEEGKYLVMATKGGIIKKTALSEYDSPRKSGLIGINLAEGDELISVKLTDGRMDIIMGTASGQAIRFSEDGVRPTGRVSMGVKGISLGKNDSVIGMDIADNSKFVLSVTEYGYGKLTKTALYPVQNRAGKGVINYKITGKTGKVCGLCSINKEEDDVMMISDDGVVIRMDSADISTMGRSTSGVKVMKLDEDYRISAIAIAGKEKDDEEDQGQQISFMEVEKKE